MSGGSLLAVDAVTTVRDVLTYMILEPHEPVQAHDRALYVINNYDKHFEAPRERGGPMILFYKAPAGIEDRWKYYPVVPNPNRIGGDYIDIGTHIDRPAGSLLGEDRVQYLASQAVALHRWLTTQHRPVQIVKPHVLTSDFRKRLAEIRFIRWPPEAARAA